MLFVKIFLFQQQKKIVEKRNDTNGTISNIWFAFGRSCTTHQRPRILFPCPSAVSKQATTLVSYSTHTHIYVCVCIWGVYTYTHTEQLSKVTFTIECHVLRPYPSPPPLTVNTVHNHDWQTLRTRTRYHAPSRLNACADTGRPSRPTFQRPRLLAVIKTFGIWDKWPMFSVRIVYVYPYNKWCMVHLHHYKREGVSFGFSKQLVCIFQFS